MITPLAESDIEPGLVLHLDARALREEGAKTYFFGRYRGGPWKRRYWLCTAVAGELSSWTPIFSRPNLSRLFLRPEFKSGPDYWKRSTAYVDPGIVYVCTWPQLVVGLRAGRDRSPPSCRPQYLAYAIPKPAVVSGRKILDEMASEAAWT